MKSMNTMKLMVAGIILAPSLALAGSSLADSPAFGQLKAQAGDAPAAAAAFTAPAVLGVSLEAANPNNPKRLMTCTDASGRATIQVFQNLASADTPYVAYLWRINSNGQSEPPAPPFYLLPSSVSADGSTTNYADQGNDFVLAVLNSDPRSAAMTVTSVNLNNVQLTCM
jgi:hypothetical protein